MEHVILKKHRVTESVAQVHGDGGDSHRSASVRLVRDDGDVRGLEIVCACGDRIVVELEYDPAPAPSGGRAS